MFKRLRAAWRPLRDGTPGKRFQQFHESRKASRRGRPWRFLFLAGGASIVVVGIILLPAPGPGWLVIFVGLGLLAQESLAIAKGLDALELRVRRLLPRARKLRRAG
jgi:uncharacterized protein (TIGR02611 family)